MDALDLMLAASTLLAEDRPGGDRAEADAFARLLGDMAELELVGAR